MEQESLVEGLDGPGHSMTMKWSYCQKGMMPHWKRIALCNMMLMLICVVMEIKVQIEKWFCNGSTNYSVTNVFSFSNNDARSLLNQSVDFIVYSSLLVAYGMV